ncbi:YihY/virulence factor BrkB family protein [Actinokineospora sp. PR83]|uniref:YhjD/YihY/BrkB family envelope integrity protein n=1 Tax=Actinokineospora sp. PR83 TaxID=2884908 RepID=UPI0027E0AECC|nr:YhjD/YihY/BrkB family envelope integrity protein [Actinokineospora sp. PR83]MCG8918960.1 YihY/virulence factor BrkB family protein [Actinokineospora sp. PR83]
MTESAGKTADKPETKLARLRARPGIDHLVRAYNAFTERYGNHFAASITYFSVLSLFPLLLVGFAVLGFVLAGEPSTLASFQESISEAAPPNLKDLIDTLVDTAIEERGKVGVIGLVTAAYTGLGWMSNLRDALTAQWGHKLESPPFLRGLLVDLLSLLGLGAALAVSFGLSAVGSGLADTLLDLVGLSGSTVARVLLFVVTTALSLGANWLVFLWVIARLPRRQVSVKSAVRGAAAAAVGFEVLKLVGTLYLSTVLGGPLGALVGPIVGLLVFANLVSRFLLFITAWTATAKENVVPEPIQPPAPAVIRPVVEVAGRPKTGQALGLVGVGAGLALLWRRRK